MKTIRGKLMMIFILVFIALSVTSIASYVAIDTQKQHLILNELLSKQKLLVERVTYTALNTAEIGLYDQERFERLIPQRRDEINTYGSMVDFMLEALVIRSYPVDGEEVPLKFDEDFAKVLDPAVEDAIAMWEDAKDEIDWLLTPEHIQDEEEYQVRVEDFRGTNTDLIASADLITEICRIEADNKKVLSERLQFGAIASAVIIFVILVWLIQSSIHRPIQEISRAFRSLANGDYSLRLQRKEADEFAELFHGYNQAMEGIEIIEEIEDEILSATELREILAFMMKSFQPFADISRIEVHYKNVTHGHMYISTDHAKALPSTGPKQTANSLLMDIEVNGIEIGQTAFFGERPFSVQEQSFILGLKEKISFALFKTILFKDLLGIVTNSLADLAEKRDPETRQHLTRMSQYARIITEALREKEAYKDLIDDEFIDNILLTAPMHDIGKISVPDSILLKPGKLSEEEYEEMKKHTFYGAHVLSKIHDRFKAYGLDYFEMAEHIANYHQEKFDGSGYPEGIKGEDIPLSARISALADVFDALTSKRPYKEAFSLEKSYGIIRESTGSHFDPDVVEAFFKEQGKIEAVYEAHKEV